MCSTLRGKNLLCGSNFFSLRVDFHGQEAEIKKDELLPLTGIYLPKIQTDLSITGNMHNIIAHQTVHIYLP